MWGFSGALSPYWRLFESPVCGGFARFFAFVLIQDGGDHSHRDFWVYFGTWERTQVFTGICEIRRIAQGSITDMVGSIQLTFPFPVKLCLNITRESKKLNVLWRLECTLWHIDTIFTAHHIVSAVSSPGRILVRALWLCRGLYQVWRLLAAKSVEKSKSKIKNGSSKH